MNLEEAIQHCYEVAEDLRKCNPCDSCAAEHEQLARWLEELVRLRSIYYGAEPSELENRKVSVDLSIGYPILKRNDHDDCEEILVRNIQSFDLDQIDRSGQCFRLTKLSRGRYVAVSGNKKVIIEPYFGVGYKFQCSREDFLSVWVPYFDLETDYDVYQKKMDEDPFLRNAIKAGGGIRILRQDFWEMVVTFTISQRNNIPRIRKTVDILCRMYGEPLGEIDGEMFFSFPTPSQLRGQDLSPASLGYREEYVKGLTEYSEDFWENLKNQDDATVFSTLTSLRGIGEKVANCIMLFGMHRMNSYPKDVWINRMIEDVYHGEFDYTPYSDFAGYVQQLQFFHYRQIARRKNAV